MIVPDNQLSLAIGKEGQNARLAARLTGWKIDIKSETQAEERKEEIDALMAEEESQVYDWAQILPEEEGEGEELLTEGVSDEDTSILEEASQQELEVYPHVSESEEENLVDQPKRKRTKKRSKQRVKELLEEDVDLYEDEDEDLEKLDISEEETEIVFAEEDSSGFTIGQLLSDELKKKFSLKEKSQDQDLHKKRGES